MLFCIENNLIPLKERDIVAFRLSLRGRGDIDEEGSAVTLLTLLSGEEGCV